MQNQHGALPIHLAVSQRLGGMPGENGAQEEARELILRILGVCFFFSLLGV